MNPFRLICSGLVLALRVAPAQVVNGPVGDLRQPASGYDSVPTPDLGDLNSGVFTVLEGLRVGVGADAYHDSNVSQGTGDNEISSFMLGFSPSLVYSRPSGDLEWSISAAGNQTYCLEDSDFDQSGHSLQASLGYDGGRWLVQSAVSRAYNDGVNRAYADSVAQVTTGFGLTVSHTLTSKTSLVGDFGASWSDPEGSYGATESLNASISAMWRYSPLLSFGPGLRWSEQGGDLQTSRTSLGPIISARYKLSEKVSANGSAGVEFASFDGGGSDQFFSFGLGIEYRLDSLWSFSLSSTRATQADGARASSFSETTGVRLGVKRRIKRGSLRCGIARESSDYTTSGGSEARPSVDYLSVDAGYETPVWGKRGTALLFLRHSGNTSSDVSRDWSSVQTGLSLRFAF